MGLVRTAVNLRKMGLLETLTFRFSVKNGRWSFKKTYKYYINMTIKSCWGSMR